MLQLDAKLQLKDIIHLQNIADKLSDDDRKAIAADVVSMYRIDRDSRAKWERITEKVIKLAALEKEKKDTPWPNASNVKTNLIALCCLQFAAKTYPEIIRNGKVVSISALGADPDGSKADLARITADYMNYQLLVESDFWEDHLDKLLHNLPLIGVAFKKTYFNPIKKANISELCSYDEIFIHNDIKSLEGAQRITHKIRMHKNKIIEKVRYNLFSPVKESILDNPGARETGDEEHEVLEQHRYLDLDGDGYEEPYIVTVLKDSCEILRICARYDSEDIEVTAKGKIRCVHPTQYFTDFHCIPNPDGSYWSLGFGHLMFSTVDSINSLINQLIDAGTLSNLQTGIMGHGIRIKGGEMRMKPGIIKKVDTAITGKLSDGFHMLDYKPPSPVLLQLLATLTNDAKELASMTDPNMGTAQVQNVASGVMSSQLEQGAKVFTGIQRRLYRGLKKEFEKLYRLNSIFLAPQTAFTTGQDQHALSAQDFQAGEAIIKPVADPTVSSDSQRAHRAEMLLKMTENQALAGKMNLYHVGLEAIEQLYPDAAKAQTFMIPPDPNAPPPPEVLNMQSEMAQRKADEQLAQQKLQLSQHDQLIKAHLADAEYAERMANAQKAQADAAAAAAGPALTARGQDQDVFLATHKSAMDLHKEKVKADSKPKPTTGE